MKKFLIRNGFEPIPIDDLKDLEKHPSSEIAGAIISTSVVSKVGESTQDVLAAVRKSCPDVPVLFASMVQEDLIEDNLRHKVAHISPTAKILPVNERDLVETSLGNKDTYLVLTKDDIGDGDTAGIADKVVIKHFR